MGIFSIQIENFKSIQKSGPIEIKPINILIGSNGVGKSNFISFFKLLNRIYAQKLQIYVNQNGRSDNFLYFGRKKSNYLAGTITFDNDYKNEYCFKLVPDQSDSLIFEEEWSNFTDPKKRVQTQNKSLINSRGSLESVLKDDDGYRNKYLRVQFSSLKIFHFHDTGFNSKIKQQIGRAHV